MYFVHICLLVGKNLVIMVDGFKEKRLLCFDCIEFARKELNESKSWEINKKRILEKTLETRIAPSIEGHCAVNDGHCNVSEEDWPEHVKEKTERKNEVFNKRWNWPCTTRMNDKKYKSCDNWENVLKDLLNITNMAT